MQKFSAENTLCQQKLAELSKCLMKR